MKATWWLHNRHLLLWTVRELSSVFVGGYALFLLVMLLRSGNEGRFHDFFFDVMLSPVVIVLQLVALAFIIYHGVTTCNAAPVLMVIWRGEEKVEPKKIIGANYGVWALLSVVIVVLAIVFGR